MNSLSLDPMLLAFCRMLEGVISHRLGRILTKSRVEHVERHLIALLGTGDRDQTLVAVLLGLVDLDDTATQVTDLVDLGSSLSNDSANHVVGDVDLLGQWLAGHDTADGSGRRRPTTSLCGGRLRRTVGRGLVRASASIRGVGSSTVGHRGLGYRSLRCRALEVRNAIAASCAAVGVRVVTLEGVGMAVLPTSGLRHVRHNLHAARHSASRTAAAGGIGRGSGAAEAFCQLLDESHGNVVGSDVHCVSNTENNKGPFSRQGKASIRSVETCTRGVLDLSNTAPTLANDRANENMGNQQTQGVCLGLGSRRGIKGLIVQGTNNKTKGLASGLAKTVEKSNRIVFKLTFAAASWGPLTVKIRSTAPRE